MNKYIIIRKHGFDSAILLFGNVSHDQAVNPAKLELDGAEVLSAGFFEIPNGQIKVDDLGSNSLNLLPRPEDLEIIGRTLILMDLAPRSLWNTNN